MLTWLASAFAGAFVLMAAMLLVAGLVDAVMDDEDDEF